MGESDMRMPGPTSNIAERKGHTGSSMTLRRRFSSTHQCRSTLHRWGQQSSPQAARLPERNARHETLPNSDGCARARAGAAYSLGRAKHTSACSALAAARPAIHPSHFRADPATTEKQTKMRQATCRTCMFTNPGVVQYRVESGPLAGHAQWADSSLRLCTRVTAPDTTESLPGWCGRSNLI